MLRNLILNILIGIRISLHLHDVREDGMVWYGMEWYGMVWYGVYINVQYCIILYSTQHKTHPHTHIHPG